MHNLAVQDTVQRAAAFNRSLIRRAEAARVISPAAAVQEPLSSEQPALHMDADSEAQPAQADAAAILGEQLPASLPTVHEEEAAASPETEAESHAGEGALESENTEGRLAPDAEAPGMVIEVPSTLEPAEATREPASETSMPEATERAQKPDQTASSTSEVKPQEQAGTEIAEHETLSILEQHDTETSGIAEAPERASTPEAARGLMQDAPQAEQLLPALMRQVTSCYRCTLMTPSPDPATMA